MVFLGIGANHHLVNKHARNRHVLGVERAGLGNVAYLGYDLPAIALGCENRVEDLQLHGFVRGGHVAHLVAGGTADKKGVDGHLVVHHVFFAMVGDDFNDVWLALGSLVHLAALDTRIDEGAQTNLAHLSWQSACHGSVKLGNLPLWEAVRNYLVARNHVHPLGLETPVRADDARHESLVRQVLNTTGPIRLAARVQKGEVARMSSLDKPLLNRLKVGLRGGDERHPNCANGCPIFD